MQQHAPRRIVVALDGTAAAREAVRWAAWQSQLTGHDLVLVHAYLPDPPPPERADEFWAASESWHRSRATRWLRQALDDSPAIPHSTRLVVTAGGWRQVLATQARGAALVVVGAGTEASLATDPRPLACPVVLVPGAGASRPPDDDAALPRDRARDEAEAMADVP